MSVVIERVISCPEIIKGDFMITLKEALNLLSSEDSFYIRHHTEPKSVWGPHHYTNLKKLREKADMKKIQVSEIRPKFSTDGYEGLELTISGITLDNCKKLCLFW